MKIKKIVHAAAIATSLTVIATPALADSQLRGGMTAIKSVANAIKSDNDYVNFKWAKLEQSRGPVVNKTERSSEANFKWAERSESSSEPVVADAQHSRHRWAIRNDSNQARHRWAIRNDSDQARHRWAIRNDSEQSRHRWAIR